MPAPVAHPVSGQLTVTGTAQALSAGTFAANGVAFADLQGVTVKAPAANAASVFIGPSGVTTSTGFELAPGDAYPLATIDPARLFVIAAAAVGDEVHVIGEAREP